jgi:ABC-type transporter Mla subunit MlaD
VLFADTGGVTPGADVFMAGKRIGRVADVAFADKDDPRKGIVLVLVIDRNINIPGDANVYIQGRGWSGGASIQLRSDGRMPGATRKDPATGQPLAWLPKEKVLTIVGAVEDAGGGGGLIPADLIADVRGAMGSMKQLAETLNDFFAPPPTPPPTTTGPGQASTTRPAEPTQPRNIHVTMAKLDQALEAINRILGDRETQDNVRTALAKFKEAAVTTEEAMNDVKRLVVDARQAFGDLSKATSSTTTKLQELAAALTDQADRLGNLLTALNAVAAKTNSGKGTASKLLNDPALYNNLVDATVQLKGTLTKLQELLEEWKRKGPKVRWW